LDGCCASFETALQASSKDAPLLPFYLAVDEPYTSRAANV
jgi:hypothetical protein